MGLHFSTQTAYISHIGRDFRDVADTKQSLHLSDIVSVFF